MLVASGLAGFVWDRFGAANTFYTGAAIGLLALAGLAWQPARSAVSP